MPVTVRTEQTESIPTDTEFQSLADRVAVLESQTVGERLAVLDAYDSLQAAINSGRTVYIPAGVWDVEPVTVAKKFAIFGEWHQSTLRFSGTNPAVQPADPTVPTMLCRFRDLNIMAASKVTDQHAFYMPSCWHWDFERVTASDFGGDGWYMWGQRDSDGNRDPSDCTKGYWRHCRSVRNQNGWKFDGTSGQGRDQHGTMGTSNMHHLSHCLASQNDVFGFHVDQGAGNFLDHCIADLNGNHGFVFAWYGNEGRRLIVEHNDGYGVYFTSHSTTHDNRVSLHDGGANTNGAHNASGSNVVV